MNTIFIPRHIQTLFNLRLSHTGEAGKWRAMLKNIQTSGKEKSALPASCGAKGDSKSIYFGYLTDSASSQALASREYLAKKLDETNEITGDFPDSIEAIADWINDNVRHVKLQYAEYLLERKSGKPRRYFSNKSHALYFLKAVAPTKLVDGGWLYGVTHRWNDARFSALIKIFLEELGEGVPNKNHALLYKQLLAANGCEHWFDSLSDDHYVQGAIQLSLAHHADHFLPEVIGFNLGYEQLPLHLLITTYELNELGIDSTYFRLHVTIDNASTGHAKKSLTSVFDLRPTVANADIFFKRIIRGQKLNALGVCATSAIASFDLDRELFSVLLEKSVAGHLLHSDYCRIGGHTVNEWLSDPARIPEFFANLEKKEWIKRGQDPRNSRFWSLIHGDNATMFGVFTAYEQQVIYDWIAQAPNEENITASSSPMPKGTALPVRQLPFSARPRQQSAFSSRLDGASARGIFRHHVKQDGGNVNHDDFNIDLRMLEEKIAFLTSKDKIMEALIPLMSPQKQYTEAGLMATRIFTKLVG